MNGLGTLRLFAQPAAQPTAVATTEPARPSTAFRPVAGGEQLQSGEKLLVEAYAAIWILVFAMIGLMWLRQRRLDARVTEVEAAISAARKKPEAG